MRVPDRDWYIGGLVDPATGESTGQPLAYDPGRFTTHGVIVGMTGSGKTGFGITVLEEALLSGVPVLAIDPKGDLGNLALRFPDLAADDFAPWVPRGDAGAVAEQWREGLAGWGIGPDRIHALVDAADVTILTPGSNAGVGLNIVGSLAAPAHPFDDDAETLRAEIAGLVAGLLALAGVDADPVAGPEHPLLQTVVEQSWRHGRDLGLADLIAQIIDPPIRQLGVFDVDEFFPPADRRALAMRLNGVIASPSFSPWLQGLPIDIPTLLWTPAQNGQDGRPRAAVLALSHLEEAQRQLAVTLVLSRLVTWMRTQPGSTDLRVLVYLDEVFGFAPPTAAPPSKEPILRILKQARAYGVGMILATQNPVDLDYKAMSNAGTWVIGRLQTERDKARVLEGLSSATGATDVAALDTAISSLGQRRFVLRSAAEDVPRHFTSRWAMSYLAGPLTGEQITRLTPAAESGGGAAAASVAPATAAAAGTATPTAKEAAPARAMSPAATDTTPVPPEVAAGIAVRYLDPAAPWADAVGADPRSTVAEAALAARVSLRYDDRAAGVDHTEEWEAVWFPLDPTMAPDRTIEVDYDDRDLRPDPPPGVAYRLAEAPIASVAFFRDAARALQGFLQDNRSVEILRNAELKLYSRVNEDPAAFAARCDAAAQQAADKETAALLAKMQTRRDRLQDAIRTAQDRLSQLEVDAKSRQTQELVAGAGAVLSALLGGRGSTRSIASRAGGLLGGAASRRSMSTRTAQRRETAEQRVADKMEDLEELEQTLLDEVADIEAAWADTADRIDTVRIGLEAGDLRVTALTLLWVPRPVAG